VWAAPVIEVSEINGRKVGMVNEKEGLGGAERKKALGHRPGKKVREGGDFTTGGQRNKMHDGGSLMAIPLEGDRNKGGGGAQSSEAMVRKLQPVQKKLQILDSL